MFEHSINVIKWHSAPCIVPDKVVWARPWQDAEVTRRHQCKVEAGTGLLELLTVLLPKLCENSACACGT